MCRVVDTTANEPDAKTEQDVNEEQTPDASQSLTQAALHQWTMRPLST